MKNDITHFKNKIVDFLHLVLMNQLIISVLQTSKYFLINSCFPLKSLKIERGGKNLLQIERMTKSKIIFIGFGIVFLLSFVIIFFPDLDEIIVFCTVVQWNKSEFAARLRAAQGCVSILEIFHFKNFRVGSMSSDI